jgi:hypothetical protein
VKKVRVVVGAHCGPRKMTFEFASILHPVGIVESTHDCSLDPHEYIVNWCGFFVTLNC